MVKNHEKDPSYNSKHHHETLQDVKPNHAHHHSSTPRKKHYLNMGEEDQMEIRGYKVDNLKSTITWIGYLATVGLLRLIFHWYPHWKLLATHTQSDLEDAQKVLITDKYKAKFKSHFVKSVETIRAPSPSWTLNKKLHSEEKRLLTIYLCDGSRKRTLEARIVRCKKLTYVWDQPNHNFLKLSGIGAKGLTMAECHAHSGLTNEEQGQMRTTYGTNEINVPVQTIPTLLVLEALTPFYIFQLFSLVVWLAEQYYYYTIAIVVMSVFGISTSIVQTRRNQTNLKGTVLSTDKVLIRRPGKGEAEEIATVDLVPGDLIVIPSRGCEMHCDAVLLSGNCIVNESMLTGESVPVTKTALPNNNKLFDNKEHVNHTLFCGTKVIQTRYYGSEEVTALVIRTGYLTSKGELVRSIMYPPPADFKFDQDSYKFIMILAAIAILSCCYTIFSKYTRDIAFWDIIIKALDVITIAIPPALPAAMTVGKLYALNRLKKKRIFCINSRVINVSGSINCICFDKTGTLTEDGLDMWGAVPIENHQIHDPIKDIPSNLPPTTSLFAGMLTCHSLTLIEGQVSGDPLDVKMFESTGWTLEEPVNDDTLKYDLLVPTIVKDDRSSSEIGIIHQYQFSSTLQRMSVICRRLGSDHFEVFCKGSPEMVMALSRPETIPEGMVEYLKRYTEQGYRVIGMATKTMEDVPFHKITKLHREEVECNLHFSGLLILENRLKPQTTQVINTLRQAGTKIVMITGDNVQTAVSVARECGIIPAHHKVIDIVTTDTTLHYHETTFGGPSGGPSAGDVEASLQPYDLVLNGTTWGTVHQHYPDLLPKVVTKGTVFARMSGHQKQQLVEELQGLGYYVAMCGDGANDCGALKAAHVGISLSEAESSVASPFTSKEPNIECTTSIVKEGRAALVTSFGVFKMMLCYSLTELTSVLILYGIDSNLTSLQFLFIDICLVLNFASFFGKCGAHDKLHSRPPMTSLLGLVPLTSIVLFMVAVIGVQVISFDVIQTYDWFTPFVYDPNRPIFYTSYENYAVFSVSMFQYITMTIVFSKGRPYRKSIFSNYWLLSSLALMTVVCCYICLYPAQWVLDALELELPPNFNGRYVVLIIALVNFVVCVLLEDFLVDFVLYKVVLVKSKLLRRFRKRRPYLGVVKELGKAGDWPLGSKAISVKSVDETNGGVVNKGYDDKEVVTTKF